MLEPWSSRQQRQLAYLTEHTSDIRHMLDDQNVVAVASSQQGETASVTGQDSSKSGLIAGSYTGREQGGVTHIEAMAAALLEFVELAALQKL